jgi:acyl dehydratase
MALKHDPEKWIPVFGKDHASGMTISKGGTVTFDPKSFNMTERRGFDDLKVGEVYRSPSRTVTEAHFAAFQVISGDNHPIHYDIEFCRAHGHRGLLAHGFQVLAASAVGAGVFPHMIGDRLIGFIEQSSKFLKGVYPGDTLYPAFTITELIPQRTTGIVVMASTIHNQNGDLVLTGEHKYLLRK